jgi:hypothetical protein
MSASGISYMQKHDIFEILKMGDFYCGDAFEVTLDGQDISTDKARRSLLDVVCHIEELSLLGADWIELTFDQGKDLLTRALQYDLAYPSSGIAPGEKVHFLREEILKSIANQHNYCYTNWFSTPGEKNNGSRWTPLTTHTFDLGIGFINQNSLTFMYFISND